MSSQDPSESDCDPPSSSTPESTPSTSSVEKSTPVVPSAAEPDPLFWKNQAFLVLRDECRHRRLSIKGCKADLVKRLENHHRRTGKPCVLLANDGWWAHSVWKMQLELENRNMPSWGHKAQMIARLEEANIPPPPSTSWTPQVVGGFEPKTWTCPTCTATTSSKEVSCDVCGKRRLREAKKKTLDKRTKRNKRKAKTKRRRLREKKARLAKSKKSRPERLFSLDYVSQRKVLDEANKVVKRFDSGHNVTLQKLFREDGFRHPVVVEDPSGLDMLMPSKSSIDVDYVMDKIGASRQVDVIDVSAQEEEVWSMRKWAMYYKMKDREETYNIISLEFSETVLSEEVEAPKIVRDIDWIDTVYPNSLKEETISLYKGADPWGESTLITHKYPKVQKYCLMGTRGSYTNFHVDFGGSSVWYHVVKGRKIFFVIPPTPENLRKYGEWSGDPKRSNTFFGDEVDDCFVVELVENSTLLLPSGWIHSVWTPEDSLVFGGNFLHGYNIGMLLNIHRIEQSSDIDEKYQLPFFKEMLWYAADHYAGVLDRSISADDGECLCDWELEGLNQLNAFLTDGDQSNCPPTIDGAAALSKLSNGLREYASLAHPNGDDVTPSSLHDYGATLTGEPIRSLSPMDKLGEMLRSRDLA